MEYFFYYFNKNIPHYKLLKLEILGNTELPIYTHIHTMQII